MHFGQALSNSGKCTYKRLAAAEDLRKYFAQPGTTTRRDLRSGVPCSVVSQKADNFEKAVWLSERDGNNPVYIESKVTRNGVAEPRSTQIEWQKTAGGHLFPRVVKHNTIIGLAGKKYDHDEVITVTHADFHSPIDPAVFTLAGLGLNEEQAIGFPDLKPEDYPIWRKGSVDSSYTASQQAVDKIKKMASDSGTPVAANPPQHSYPGGTSTTLVVAVVAAVMSVAAAVAAVVIRRRRTPS